MKVKPLVRAFGELLIIVVGVLIALSAESWRETAMDREAEETHLRSLLDDLGESRRLLAESNAGFEQVASSLVHLLEDDLGAAAPDSVVAWIENGLFRLYGYQPRMTTLRDLETSNQLGLLTPSVRRGIADLGLALTQLTADQDGLLQSQQGVVDPFLISRLRVTPLIARSSGLPLSANLGYELDWSALSGDEGQSIVAFKLSLWSLTQARREEVMRQIELLTSAVERRLSEVEG